MAAAGEGHGGVGTCSAVQPGAGGLHVAVGWLLILKCSRRPGFTASPVSKLSDWLILAFRLTGCNCPSVSFGVFLPCNLISNLTFILYKVSRGVYLTGVIAQSGTDVFF